MVKVDLCRLEGTRLYTEAKVSSTKKMEDCLSSKIVFHTQCLTDTFFLTIYAKKCML